jgi:hypothetical protein
MPRYIDAETIPALFNEKFNETQKLIEAGETQLDNFAEGFAEAEKIVLFKAPTADVQEAKHGHWACLGWGEWLEEAKEVLEKQTPKKITHTATLKTSCTCPNCGNCLDKFEKFGESIVRVKYQYCHFCGQALDWGEV